MAVRTGIAKAFPNLPLRMIAGGHDHNGDAAVSLEGLDQKVGATSTITVAFIVPALLVQTCENLLALGIKPDVYYNGHLAYEDQSIKSHNDALVEKYFYRMRNL